jgi:prevent-host-death family protein
MITATIREARAKLNLLIDRALAGEDVVLLRGSKPVVALTPITEADLELSYRISDEQADRLWAKVRADRAAGKVKVFESMEAAVATLGPEAAGARRRQRRSAPLR